MPDPIVDVATWTTTVNAPLAGEEVTGASVKIGEQALANRTAFLRSKVAQVSVARPQVVAALWSPTYWKANPGVMYLETIAGNNGTGDGSKDLLFPLSLPDGATIAAWDIAITGAPAHAGAIGQRPIGRLQSLEFVTGTGLILDTVTDGVTVLGTYQAFHVFGSSGLSIVANRTSFGYYLRFTHESGTNSIEAGLRVHGVRVGYTLPADRNAGGI